MGELASGPLQVERMDDGRRMLIRDLIYRSRGEEITVPRGFITDYSSIPYMLLVIVLFVFSLAYRDSCGPFFILALLAIPRFSRVDIAGVVHDYLYVAAPYGKWEADLIWRDIAMSGNHRANFFQAYLSWFFGLVIGGIPAWLYYRHVRPKQIAKDPFPKRGSVLPKSAYHKENSI